MLYNIKSIDKMLYKIYNIFQKYLNIFTLYLNWCDYFKVLATHVAARRF